MSMLQKYLHFSKKRVACFIFISIAIFVLQFVLTGSMLAKQQVTTEAGNSQSSVIGILDDTEIIRQKFQFDRKVVLSGFTLSFGSFEYDKVGTDLHIQMLDGENITVYETTIPVKDIKPDATYTVKGSYGNDPERCTCCLALNAAMATALCNVADTKYDQSNRSESDIVYAEYAYTKEVADNLLYVLLSFAASIYRNDLGICRIVCTLL